MIAFPNIKINLGLHIINKRDDGFHNIESVFYPIPFCDTLEVITNQQPRGKKVVLHMEGLPVVGNLQDNIIIKAYYLLDKDFGLPPVQICLLKNIPMGAGLGGGSSDAAHMITLLNNKYSLQLSIQQMKDYAAVLGSDCAFFIENKPAYLFGKGHELSPFSIDITGYYFVLITPKIHSNTAMAYKGVVPRGDAAINLNEILAQPVYTWKDTLVNDFEETVFRQHPQISVLKQLLYDFGAVYASMSGSGSALFGIFKDKPQLPNDILAITLFEGKL